MMWTRLNLVLLAAAGLLVLGCEGAADELAKKKAADSKAAVQAAKDMTDKATEAAKDITDKADAALKEKGEELAAKSSEIASQLGDQAMALLGPLKEKIAGLDSLVDKPAEMKTVVTELLGTLDSSMANLPVPDAVKSGLTALKEQLTKLLEHLGGTVDAAKVQEFLKTIKEIVGSKLGS